MPELIVALALIAVLWVSIARWLAGSTRDHAVASRRLERSGTRHDRAVMDNVAKRTVPPVPVNGDLVNTHGCDTARTWTT